MDENKFYQFLINNHTEKGSDSRIQKGQIAERILNASFDSIVLNDEAMYNALCTLNMHEDPEHKQMQNALRLYYVMVNGHPFPKLKDCFFRKM